MARECGKVVSECRAEVVEGLHMIQYVFGTGRTPIGDVFASEIAEKDAFMRRKPWGVVAVITPWNFPFAVPLWMLGPSLLEGNTAVFKPSEDTPAIGQRLAELFVEAGFPAGVLNLVHGAGEAGEALVRDADVNVVLFTGSYEVGRRIQAVVGQLLRPHHCLRNGQQERRHRLRRRPPRFGRQLRPHQCIQDERSALRFGRPHSRGRSTVRPLRREVGRGGATACASAIRSTPAISPVPSSIAARSKRSRATTQLARKEGATVLLDGGRLTGGEHAAGCYLSPFIYRMEHRPGVRVHA